MGRGYDDRTRHPPGDRGHGGAAIRTSSFTGSRGGRDTTATRSRAGSERDHSQRRQNRSLGRAQHRPQSAAHPPGERRQEKFQHGIIGGHDSGFDVGPITHRPQTWDPHALRNDAATVAAADQRNRRKRTAMEQLALKRARRTPASMTEAAATGSLLAWTQRNPDGTAADERQAVRAARFAAPVSARRPAPAAQRKRENMVSLLRQPPIRASSTLEGALIEVKEELGVSAPAAAAAVGV